MDKKVYLKTYRIVKLDDITVHIDNKFFSFSYTIAKHIVKEEFKDKYRYFGGLQTSENLMESDHKLLEMWLCEIAEKVLNHN